MYISAVESELASFGPQTSASVALVNMGLFGVPIRGKILTRVDKVLSGLQITQFVQFHVSQPITPHAAAASLESLVFGVAGTQHLELYLQITAFAVVAVVALLLDADGVAVGRTFGDDDGGFTESFYESFSFAGLARVFDGHSATSALVAGVFGQIRAGSEVDEPLASTTVAF